MTVPHETTHHGTGTPFGWEASVRRASNAPGERVVTVRRKGRRADILRAAALVPHAEGVEALDSYDEASYKRAFGWGKT